VATRKEKEDVVMKCGKEKGKGRRGDEVWQRERPFSLPHFITQSSLSFLFATLHHPVFLFLSLCHTSSPSLPFPFSLPHFITQSSFSFLFVTLYHPIFHFLSLCHTKEKTG
jgi:hypothetical protein